MTKTEELLKLAEAAGVAQDHIWIHRDYFKQLVELVRLQHEALKWVKNYEKPFDDPYEDVCEAIAAYERFEKGEG